MRLDDVILALYMTSDSSEAFYDMVAHEITWLDDNALAPEEYNETAERMDTHGFKRLPDKHDINEYNMMEAFLEACDFPQLINLIHGRGAFARFRSSIRQLGLEQEWYKFRDAESKRIALEWCNECGIVLGE